MDGLPDDTAARRQFLQDWAGRQQLRTAQTRVRTRLRMRLAWARITLPLRLERIASRVFDRGLDTSPHAWEPEHEHRDRVGYAPSPWHALPRALRYIGVSDRDVFVDFGCGKGRVVHQAARRPFRRVIGVEISPVLAEAARSVLAARRNQYRCRDVEILVADVTAFRVPDDLTVGYFYRPVDGEAFKGVLRGIIQSIDRNPRRVRLIYLGPTEEARSQILGTGRFRVVKEQRTWLLDIPVHSPATIFESR